MLARPSELEESLIVLRPEDRVWGFFLHLLGWIPVWGFVLCAAVWLLFKNRSREMIFHVQQTIQFQIVVLVPMVVWIVASLLIALIGTLSPGFGNFLAVLNNFILSAVLTACAGVAVWGAVFVYLGKPFLYPFIGRRVLEGSISKLRES